MSEEQQRRARSFGGVADAYDRGRPSYPDDAAAWLVGGEARSVLELGAGTGKLTERLVGLGHDVHATDPDPHMLGHLQRRLPDVRTSQTTAEEIPAADASYDVVVAAQCFHWFDVERALPEIARVLRPGGHLAVVWHERDERVPWVRKLGRILGTQDQTRDPAGALADAGLFEDTETQTFSFWQAVDRRTIRDLLVSRSNVAVLDDAAREARLADLMALYDDYGRGMDGMQVPYRTRCFRSVVLPKAAPAPPPEPRPEPEATLPINLVDSAATIPRVAAHLPDDDGVLLIDFR